MANRKANKKRISFKMLKELQQRSLHRHYTEIGFRCILLLINSYFLLVTENIIIKVILIFIQAFLFFGFTSMIHESVHNHIPYTSRLVRSIEGRFYQSFLGLPLNGYKFFHLEHHQKLSTKKDPEYFLRKIQTSRMIKFLALFFYIFGIHLFFISLIFSKKINEEMKSALKGDYVWNVIIWVVVIYLLFNNYTYEALYLYVLPWFAANPISYVVHIGRHMNSNPNSKEQQTPIVLTNRITDFLTCNIFYHKEHHDYASIPWFNLKQVREYEKTQTQTINISQLLWSWFIENKQPYTIWSKKSAQSNS